MNLSDFIASQPHNRLLRHNRLITNWVLERDKSLLRGEFMALHRLASKRVVLEVSGARSKHGSVKLLIGLSVLLTIGAAIAFSVSNRTPTVRSSANPSASAAACKIPELLNVKVAAIEDFQISGWRFSAKALGASVGQLQSMQFTANCLQNTISGRMIAARQQDEWQIKRVVLID